MVGHGCLNKIYCHSEEEMKMKNILLGASLTCLMTLGASKAISMDYAELSLDDLMNIQIVESVTKLPEELFKAPVSVSIIERDKIQTAGITSIPEALRLVPGVIVREQTPGNYDVHLRGFDNATVNSLTPFPQNTVTLVMIDYRIVYNYFAGGTLWESLPVSIDDVKQIEVIRGPSSALYGPNAVAGVINIVTDKPQEEGWVGRGSYKVGTDYALSTSSNFGYQDSRGVTMQFASQYQSRNRQNTDSYLWNDFDYQTYTSITSADSENATPLRSVLTPDESIDYNSQFSNPEKSMENYSAYFLAGYQINQDVNVEVNGSMQTSLAQKIFVNNFATPLTETNSETFHGEAKVKAKNTHVSVGYLQGNQSVTGQPDWAYAFDVVDVVGEHFLQVNDLLLKPTVSYRTAIYDGKFIGGEKDISSVAGALLADYKINEQFRVMGATRTDKYEHTDELASSYQGSFTYAPNFDHLIRTSIANAKQAPSMVQTHIDHSIQLDLGDVNYKGNLDLVPLEQSTVELGYRTKAIPMVNLDFELFYSQLTNLSDLSWNRTDAAGDTYYKYENTNIDAEQKGLSLGATVSPISWAELIFGGTYQQTTYKDVGNNVLINDDIQTTPEIFGNTALVLTPIDWFTLWTDVYYMDQMTFKGLVGEDEVEPVVVLNVTSSFKVHENVTLQASGRNLTSEDQSQYGFTEQLGPYYYLGVNANF